jgi:hypothetical protein
MVWNGVLLVGVPMAALLVAALYMYGKAQWQMHGPGGSGFRKEPWTAGELEF